MPNYLKGISGAELTRLAMRPELRLQRLLSDEYAGSWNALLGELQPSFLLLLYVSSLAALDQWKSMVALLCASIPACDALRARVLSVLKAQLDHPKDFFTDILSATNFLQDALASAFEVDHENEAPAAAIVTPSTHSASFLLVGLASTCFH